MENFKIYSQVLKQYKDLTCKEEKLFYYAYGKYFVKVMSIMKEKRIREFEEFDFEGFTDYQIDISYNEIKALANVKRVDKNNFIDIRMKLLDNTNAIAIIEEESTEMMFLYRNVFFNNKERIVSVTFTKEIEKLFELCKGEYTRILIEDLKKITKTYELKLYLYCSTIFREQKKCGIMKVKMVNLRKALNPAVEGLDANFYSRYIKKPCDALKNLDLYLEIQCKKERDLVTFTVTKPKIKEETVFDDIETEY